MLNHLESKLHVALCDRNCGLVSQGIPPKHTYMHMQSSFMLSSSSIESRICSHGILPRAEGCPIPNTSMQWYLSAETCLPIPCKIRNRAGDMNCKIYNLRSAKG